MRTIDRKPGAKSRIVLTVVLCAVGVFGVWGGQVFAGSAHEANLAQGAHFASTGSMVYERASHSATLLPDGTVLVAGGQKGPVVLSLSEIYNPASNAFERSARLKQARKDHTATILSDGEVLVVGGDDGQAVTATGEVFDPASGLFDSVGGLAVPRTFHTATLLKNGSVLIAGGSSGIGSTLSPLDTVELFDPSKHKFSVGLFLMLVTRAMHTATAIDHGKAVLIAGGINLQGGVESSAELYDAGTGLFTPTDNSMQSARYGHIATRLNDGTVLITGGLDEYNNLLDSADIYDPKTRTFTAIGPMTYPRAFHAASILMDGRVLITGGIAASQQDPNFNRHAEIYDPATKTFSGAFVTIPALTNEPRNFYTASLLQNGKVLLAGGTECCESPQEPDSRPYGYESAEVFSPKIPAFAALPAGMIQPRALHTATLLHDGRVLIVGGEDTDQTPAIQAAEIYSPAKRSFTGLPISMNNARSAHTATLLNCASAGCPNGQVLLTGGIGVAANQTGVVDLAAAELYDPASRTFSDTGSLTTARDAASATALSDGRVLIAGGEQVNSQGTPVAVLASAEIYDPSVQTFSCVGGESGNPPACNASMTTPRVLHSATLLADGTVLLTGGLDNSSNVLASAELFDPAANSGQGAFTATGSMNTPRAAHTATYLKPNAAGGPLAGGVLIAGGSFDSSAEVYDPSTGIFSCVAGAGPGGSGCKSSMTQVRFLATATLLDSGEVLIAGGSLFTARSELFPENSAELFDPQANGGLGSFTATANMTTSRVLHTATLLGPSVGPLAGAVLIVGGEQTDGTLNTAELFTSHRQ